MTQTPAQAHAAAVRRHAATLGWRKRNLDHVAALITEAGEMYAAARVEDALRADRAEADKLIDRAAAERDMARRELEQAHDAYRKVIAQRDEAQAERDEWKALAGALRSQRDDATAERDRLREQIAAAKLSMRAAGGQVVVSTGLPPSVPDLEAPPVAPVPAPGGDAAPPPRPRRARKPAGGNS